MSRLELALDLTKNHGTRTFGDITVFMTWHGSKQEPCIVLMPTAKIGHENVVPCVVALSTAWAWAEETGDGRHCARWSLMFAKWLGFNPHNVNDVMRITSVVRNCLGDLLTIPPRPNEKVVVADAIRTDEYGRQHHSEIVENV